MTATMRLSVGSISAQASRAAVFFISQRRSPSACASAIAERFGMKAQIALPLAELDHQREMALDQSREIRPLKRRRLDQGRQQPDQGEPGIEDGLDLVDADPLVVQQGPHAVDRFLVQLDRRDHEVSGGERGDETDVRIRMGVDQTHIEPVVDGLEKVAQVAREGRVQRRLALEREQRIAGADEDEAAPRVRGRCRC
jgi:hypothetical protein